MIEKNLENITQKINAKCNEIGRNLNEITLVAVSKLKPFTAIEEALEVGIRDFGENRTPEFKQKAEALSKEINWHFIGHIQTKKTKDIVPFASLIHSVDTLKLAKEINKRAENISKVQHVLIEMKTSEEESKLGIESFEDTIEILDFCKSEKYILVDGLMTMAPFTNDENVIRKSFRKLKSIFDTLNNQGYNLKHLSMGMTNDYEIAIEEGATILRVGTAIFGERNYS
ncbi:MAG: YggS family pyridoxal phosphate-dependent enzyme [Ignavibacteriae bacterium]|nr:YggS family pyridoxal phosphate-dependent enzyme [Ignavibacteriota bacterium]